MKPRVLITRDAERAAELIGLLEQREVVAFAEPVTRTVFLSQQDKIPPLETFDWLVFTSANGVRGLVNALDSTPLPVGLKTAAVGPGTAETASQFFRPPDFVARHNDAASLAVELLEEDPELAHRAVLWPCAAQASVELATRLKDAGTEVVRIPVYRTQPVPPEELLKRLTSRWPWSIAVFAAPSAISSFASAWPTPWDFPCVAIGAVTAKALAKAGAHHVHVSSRPGAAELRDTILEMLKA